MKDVAKPIHNLQLLTVCRFVSGCAGVIVGHPFDTVKVNLQTQDPKNLRYTGTFHCLKSIVAKESVRGLYKGMASPMAGVAAVNAIVFGVYGNIQRHSSNPDALKTHFLAGSIAGLTQSVVCSPMELIKTKLQLQDKLPTAVKYKGPLDCLQGIWKHEGLRGVYRGLGITAARDLPGFSSYFVTYEMMVQNKDASSFQIMMAGGFAGAFSWIACYPIDVLKTRLQMDGSGKEQKYNGVVDCFKKSYQAEGASFLTRGLSSTLVRAFPMNAVCFLVVTQVLKLFTNTEVTIEIEKKEIDHQHHSKKTVIRMKFDDDIDYIHRIKANTIRGLTLMGAFHENSICHTEIFELTNDFHNDDYYVELDNNHKLRRQEDELTLDLK